VSTGSTVASTPAASVLPPPVEQAEALAEDVQSDLDRNAGPAAEAKLRELTDAGEKLASVGVAQTKRSAYGNALDSLGATITRRSRPEALMAGNHVSRVVTGIMADYPTKYQSPSPGWMSRAVTRSTRRSAARECGPHRTDVLSALNRKVDTSRDDPEP
jgi:hypothetical protein